MPLVPPTTMAVRPASPRLDDVDGPRSSACETRPISTRPRLKYGHFRALERSASADRRFFFFAGRDAAGRDWSGPLTPRPPARYALHRTRRNCPILID